MEPDVENAVLRGEALRTATPEDAERLARQFERGRFLKAQKTGVVWSPTREMLEEYRLYQLDDSDRIRRNFLLLKWVSIVQSGLILLLFILRK